MKYKRAGSRFLSFVLAAVLLLETGSPAAAAETAAKKCICGKEEHTHTEECYEEKLICGKKEGPGHTHTESCYKEVKELICDLEEGEEHTHTEDCYHMVKKLICGQEEYPPHTHTAECYEKVLVCGKEEHTHTDACYEEVPAEPEKEEEKPKEEEDKKKEEEEEKEEEKKVEEKEDLEVDLPVKKGEVSNDAADVESRSRWEKTLPAVLEGDWNARMVQVAQSQLGYRESTRNFRIRNGNKKGYTRYGAWYGMAYEDWCAMFVCFCLHYAGVPKECFPRLALCSAWVQELGKMGYFEAVQTGYVPTPGDLIFFQPATRYNSGHVGIVEDVVLDAYGNLQQILTIEGNSGNQVRRRTYQASDRRITGFGALAKAQQRYYEENGMLAAPTEPEKPVVIVRGITDFRRLRQAVETFSEINLRLNNDIETEETIPLREDKQVNLVMNGYSVRGRIPLFSLQGEYAELMLGGGASGSEVEKPAGTEGALLQSVLIEEDENGERFYVYGEGVLSTRETTDITIPARLNLSRKNREGAEKGSSHLVLLDEEERVIFSSDGGGAQTENFGQLVFPREGTYSFRAEEESLLPEDAEDPIRAYYEITITVERRGIIGLNGICTGYENRISGLTIE